MVKNRTILFVISLLTWLFASLCPWQGWLEGFDVLRFALGVFIYLFPGMLAFLNWNKEERISGRTLLG